VLYTIPFFFQTKEANIDLEGDDGGIFKRTNPTSSNGKWLCISGNVRNAECHSGDYDFQTGLAICGAQDQGTLIGAAGDRFYMVAGGDGGTAGSAQQTTPHLFFKTNQFLGVYPGTCNPYGVSLAAVNLSLPFPWSTQVG